MAPALILLGGLIGFLLVRQYRANVEKGLVQEGVDLKWTPTQVIVFPLMAVFSGLFASLLGTGVGLLLTPIMLDLNMETEAVAATSALMHLLSALAALVDYSIANEVLWYHCLVLLVVSCAGQLFGQSIVDFLVRHHASPRFRVCVCVCWCFLCVHNLHTSYT